MASGSDARAVTNCSRWALPRRKQPSTDGARAAAAAAGGCLRLQRARRPGRCAGQFVIVPLGKRETLGVVWGEGTGEVAAAKLRDVIEVLPAPADGRSAAPLRRLGRGLHARAARRGAAHGDELAVGARSAPDRARSIAPVGDAGDTLKLTAARRRVLEALKDGPAMPAAELAHLAGVGTSVIKTMAAAGLLEAVERTCAASFPRPDGARDGPTLSPAQKAAADALIEQGEGARLLGDPARRRDRRGQDRGLFRGGRRGAARPAGRCWCCCPRSR